MAEDIVDRLYDALHDNLDDGSRPLYRLLRDAIDEIEGLRTMNGQIEDLEARFKKQVGEITKLLEIRRDDAAFSERLAAMNKALQDGRK